MVIASNRNRIDWVDYSKGICILLVVMMHSTLGVEKAAGSISWLHGFIEWAKPFRMPDFFLISGLFLGTRIDRPWRDYLDSKVVHFFYFYILWMTIQFGLRGPGIYADGGAAAVAYGYLMGFVQPFGTLWFIYVLAVFFVVTKWLKTVSPVVVFIFAAFLEALPIETGSLLVDEFASRFVYFYAGYWLASRVFAWADHVNTRSIAAIFAGLFIWGALNGALVASGFAGLPLASLALGFTGAGAVVATGVLFAKLGFMGWLRYCGENSIVIYLAFVLFMAATRTLLLKTGLPPDLGAVSLIVTAVSATGAVGLHWLVRGTRLDFIFRRPAWAKLPRSTVDIVSGNRRQVHNI